MFNQDTLIGYITFRFCSFKTLHHTFLNPWLPTRSNPHSSHNNQYSPMNNINILSLLLFLLLRLFILFFFLFFLLPLTETLDEKELKRVVDWSVLSFEKLYVILNLIWTYLNTLSWMKMLARCLICMRTKWKTQSKSGDF